MELSGRPGAEGANFVVKMVNFLLKMLDFVVKMLDFVLKCWIL